MLLSGLSIAEPVDWVGDAFGGHLGVETATRSRAQHAHTAGSA